jgi:outer membrane autotransporter protein
MQCSFASLLEGPSALIGRAAATWNETNMESGTAEFGSRSVVVEVPASSGSNDGRRPANDRLTMITLVLLAGVWFTTIAARAQDATWSSTPATDDWRSGANWVPTSPPTGTATFDQSTRSSITLGVLGTSISVGTLQFNAGAPAYTFNVSYNLFLTGGGIVNHSSNSPVFAIGNTIFFQGSSTAGNATINLSNSARFQSSDGQFQGTSTAGNATIIVGENGTLQFSESSTADNATITVENGRRLLFSSTSTGGEARLITAFGGVTEIDNLSSDGMTAGSIEGAGTYQLGSKALTVGLNNLSTEASGTIVDFGEGGSLIKVGRGTLTLSGINTYSGGTTVSKGVLSVAVNANLGAVGGEITLDGGELLATGRGLNTGRQVTITTNGGTLATAALGSADFEGNITGGGALTIGDAVNTGTVVLGGTNTYLGSTTIVNGATLLANSPAALSPTSAFIVMGTLDLNGFSNQIGSLASSGTVTNGDSFAVVLTTGGDNTDTSFSGVLQDGTDALGLIKVGTGTLTLSGASTYTGGTTISAGTLQLGDGVRNGSITGDVTDNATLAFDPAGSVTFGGTISGTGNLLKLGSGTVILTANNSYIGGTTISGGILQIGNGGTTGSIVGNVVDDGSLVFNRTDAITFPGIASGTGTLFQSGSGSLTLTGSNSYSGVTTVSAGTLQAGSTTAFSPNSAFTVNSVVNLAGFSNTVGSLAGNGMVTNNGNPAILTAGGNGTNTVFSGTLINGTASLGLIKSGLGTLTLSGANTYTGGTTITGGNLQIGNGGTTGSIVGNVLDNGSLVFNRSDAITFPGVVSGTGSLTQTGSGSMTLTNANTYSGGTVIDRGTLLVDNAQALGTGYVTVNGGILAADPQPINVKGNYTQNAGGTLQLNVAGANPGQYDTLNVGGSAALGGTLKLISLGFQPKAGDTLTLVTNNGLVSGRFAQFIDPFATGPGFTFSGLVYEPNAVLLEFRSAASFALTPNQLAAARLLDAVHQDSGAANLISFLNTEPFTNLPGDFEKISPDGLTAFYEISFSNANIQKLTLESRFDDIHHGSNGFSSNMKVNGATVNDKAGPDGKTSKAVVEPVLQHAPENRWGVWVTGFGDFVNVDGDGNAQGYNFTTGGVSLGLDYRLTDQLAIGVFGDYSHTWTSLNPGGHIDVDSGRGGVYATWFSHGIYLNAAIYGGHNSYDSGRAGLGGLANGSTEGAEWSTFIGGGYDFHCGRLTVGPIASLQYTDVGIDSFSEHGSLAPLAIHSNSAESLRSDLGFRLFYQWQIGKIIVEPSLKAAWEHEYKYSALPVTAGFAGIPGPSATFFGPSEGHDSAVVSAGVSVQATPAITTYVNYDGQLGRGNYDSNAVTGGFRISF